MDKQLPTKPQSPDRAPGAKSFAEAKAHPHADHMSSCTPCSIYASMSNVPAAVHAKQLFETKYACKFPVVLGNIFHWRTHVKLACQAESQFGGLKMGLYKEGTHEVEPLIGTQEVAVILHELAVTLAALAAGCRVHGASPVYQ